jgi:hypothetical protein
MPSEIRFEDIKAHGGDQRRAFEELCFQLFAQEYHSSGEVVRREGAGGDRGLEGYLCDSQGLVLVGVQAKLFLGQFRSEWWSQMDDSARTAIEDNASDGQLQRYIFCTPRTFTGNQRQKWENKRLDWKTVPSSSATPRHRNSCIGTIRRLSRDSCDPTTADSSCTGSATRT